MEDRSQTSHYMAAADKIILARLSNTILVHLYPVFVYALPSVKKNIANTKG